MTGDPLLPRAPDVPAGERLVVDLPGAGRAEGVLYRGRYEGWEALWRARRTFELTPLPGAEGPAALSALLRVLRGRVDRERPGADSACVVTRPSRDLAAGRVLLDAGLLPSTVLGVRPAGDTQDIHDTEDTGGVTIRRASTADVAGLVELWLAELRYSALAGPGVLRPGAAGLVGAELRRAVRAGEPVWLAESAGMPVGLAVCGRPAPDPARLPPGSWGRVGTVSVAPGVRGTGIGRALMAVAHRDLLAPGARGTYLFYSPHNALASVFWHRQGYRPLWTTWEVRPATALR
ncbi:acetyltransferase (GNAT) family protein [Prauserella shujinwangii]|uniref:Acetyltransferase (GNAT) family protein n=1 Tax=Prauserella shujinwangii TaxID=1453103 RepID=A0A2T0LSR0_9PSEU|nr:GNAT family N-acetyltransferase [Prauserella shujinwangii]PRX46710.1 acetyltransferase (GNAT) family protein [Prauserella shujinwangii]